MPSSAEAKMRIKSRLTANWPRSTSCATITVPGSTPARITHRSDYSAAQRSAAPWCRTIRGACPRRQTTPPDLRGFRPLPTPPLIVQSDLLTDLEGVVLPQTNEFPRRQSIGGRWDEPTRTISARCRRPARVHASRRQRLACRDASGVRNTRGRSGTLPASARATASSTVA